MTNFYYHIIKLYDSHSITHHFILYRLGWHQYGSELYLLEGLGDLQVQACGSMVTEEQPHAMMIPLEYFLMGYGLYRPSQSSVSPRSPLSPSGIAPELFSPESMGLKLKPIKTRISLQI
jgi:hypothetical protein